MITLDNVNDMPLSAGVPPETRAKLESLVLNGPKESSCIPVHGNDFDPVETVKSPRKEREIDLTNRDNFHSDGCDRATALRASSGTARGRMINDESDGQPRKRRSRDSRNSFNPEYSVIQSAGYGPSIKRSQDAADGRGTCSCGYPATIDINFGPDSEGFHAHCLQLAFLDSLHLEQEKKLAEQVRYIARRLPRVASPLQKRNDLYAWREIFKLYIDASIFFSSLEQDQGERSIGQAKEQLTSFMDQVQQMNLIDRLKSPESKALFKSFLMLNKSLLQSAEPQGHNHTAAAKASHIQAELTTREMIPELCSELCFNNPLRPISTSVVKSIHSTMTKQLLALIPQLDDYICPVCYLIAFKPVRLDCGHVFCIRCVVKLRRQHKYSCPICRQNVLLTADERNIDVGLYNQMLLYFPKETKEKQAANDKESAMEKLPHLQSQKTCVIQ
ncbi:hypothetical protein V1517DRAFT_320229 [Lipomyces orientalis]|uniref:Uncharacterized protein n=1 Tax=Lipomyces orientalis TaxID=1233043 RepID=A0ACC3TRM3_9ASCO